MTKASHIMACMLLVLLFAGVESATADTTVVWQLFSGGGANVSNDDYQLRGSLRQTAIRLTVDTSGFTYALGNGFWPYTRSLGPCCWGIRGNVDDDPYENVDVSDLGYLTDYLFNGGPAPNCTEEADCDESTTIDVADVGVLVDYLFREGPAPPACP